MRSGTLRHRVAIQAVTKGQGGFKQPTETWATVRTVWAAWETPTGREAISANQLSAQLTHAFRLRRPGLTLTPRHRLKIGPRIFAITACYDGANRGREVLVTATETPADGVT
jgi:SPP1 family predicted phage head-tail adaptor